jgi:hypothetical protein
MDIYLAGTQVTLVVPLEDRSGNPISVTSVSYRVISQDGTEVVALAAVDGFVDGDVEVTVVIPALVNVIAEIPESINSDQIDTFSVREVRTAELYLNAGGNTVMLTKSYALEPTEALIVGINSFQTLPQAELTSLDVPNTPGWDAASDRERIAALVDARVRICQLSFSLSGSLAQNNIGYGVSDGAGDLAALTPTQYVNLSVRLRVALAKAQLAEADAILGGDPAEIKRQEGITLDVVGESRQAYRQGKPLDLPISKRALRYLSKFISFSKTIGRGS